MLTRLAALALAAFAVAAAPPHLVLFCVDDLGHTDVGYHGSEIPTPNIDKLSGGGVRLERYYTQPVCSPTRSTFMTGRYVHQTGFYWVMQMKARAHLPFDMPTLPERLQAAGYETHMLGKWHLGYDTWNATPTGRGFSSHFGFFQGDEDYFNKSLAHAVDGSVGFDFWDNRRPAFEYQGGYSLTQYMERAHQLVSNRDVAKPFFLYFSHQTIHAPIEGLPTEIAKEYEGRCPAGQDPLRVKYCGMMAYFDDTVAEFTGLLADAGMWDNTLLFFSTDNGGCPQGATCTSPGKSAGCNWPLRASKASTFEGGVRGVAFVAGGVLPSHVRGTERQGLMHSSDVYATLLGAAGEALPADIDGVDQWAAIAAGSASPRSTVLISEGTYDALGRGFAGTVIRGDMKLIAGETQDDYWHCENQSRWEGQPASSKAQRAGGLQTAYLFNLTADPAELHNLAGARPETVAELGALLTRAHAEAVPPTSTEMDPAADAFAIAHNRTIAPWADASPPPAPPTGCQHALAADGCLAGGTQAACQKCAQAHQQELKAAGCTTPAVKALCSAAAEA